MPRVGKSDSIPWMSFTVLKLLPVAFAVTTLISNGQSLERLKYNHPGLQVDLGVGLWAWPLPMDMDGDGDFDLAVNCPDKPSNGLYFFENNTGDTGADAMPVFRPGVKISKGLQNVQISHGGGKWRVTSPNMEYPDFLNSGLNNGKKLGLKENIHPNKVRGNMWKFVDYDSDGLTDVIVGADDWTDYGWDNAYDASGKWTRGPLRGFVYVLRNIGSSESPGYAPPEKLKAGKADLETFGWPSPCFGDFDADGDLDLICGEFLDGFTYFKNVGTRKQPVYAAGVKLKTNDGKPLVMDLEMITPTVIDWDKDHHLDLIVGDEDGRVAFIKNATTLSGDGVPQFLAPQYFKQQAEDVKFGALATPVGVDWDGDGDTDIVSGNTAGYIGFIENLSGPKVESPKWEAPVYLKSDGDVIRIMAGPNGSIQGPAEAKWGYTTLSVADWDGDGLPDLLVNSIFGKVMWYRNAGTRQSPKLDAAQPIEVEWNGAQPALVYGWMKPEGKALLTQWRTTPVAVDWNMDGLMDLVMLDQEGYLCLFERSRNEGRLVLLAPRRAFHGVNFSVTDGRGKITNATPGPMQLNACIAGKSGRRKLCIVDWDGDGKLDILSNSVNANFLKQVEAKDGNWYFEDMGPLVNENIEGHDVSPTTVDFNGDGIPDFLGGAEDGKFYYLKNSRS